MPTLRSYRHEVSRKLGGFKIGTVTIDPEPLDSFGQRSVLAQSLYDADKGSKGYSNQFCWVGKYRDQRRFRENGYRSLAYAVFTPPDSGVYALTFYGFGTTADLDWDTESADILTAITALSGLTTVTISGTGDPYVLALPDVIDTEISAGTMIATGGIGALEVQRGFTRALVAGDEFEIHSKLPVDDDDNIQGLNTLINMALRRMWFIDRFPITPIINSRGIKTFYGLTDYDWLTHKNQIIAVYDSTLWQLDATFTPPASGSYTLQLTVAPDTFITDSLAYTATGQEIQDAFEDAGAVGVTVLPLTLDTEYVITLPETYYAVPTVAASTGTVVNERTQLEDSARLPQNWSFEYDGERPFLRNIIGMEGRSFYVESYRPGHSWVCPQASYGTLGDTWQATADGLEDDYDQAVPSIEDVASVAYAIACRQLVSVGPGHEREQWENEAKRAERQSAVTKLYDLPFNDKPSGGTSNVAGTGNSKGFWGRY